MRNLFAKSLVVTPFVIGALWAGTVHAQNAKFVQSNLVSSVPGLAAITDSELINPWGVSHSTTSPFSGSQTRNQYRDALYGHREDDGHQGTD